MIMAPFFCKLKTIFKNSIISADYKFSIYVIKSLAIYVKKHSKFMQILMIVISHFGHMINLIKQLY
jgi:hypothetical protein